jgi:hypothetical protein
MQVMPIFRLSNLEQFAAVNVTSDPGHFKGKFTIPAAIQVTLRWQLEDGKFGHNVLYMTVPGAFQPTSAIADAILLGLTDTPEWTALAAFLAGTAGLTGVLLRDKRALDTPIVPSSAGGGRAGASISPEMPDETALVVTLRTSKVGARFRGRMFVPGWATNALGTGNVAAPAVVTALQNWSSTIRTVFAAEGGTWALGLPPRNAYTGSSGTPHEAQDSEAPSVATNVVRDNHWDTQRRRGLK